MPSRFPSGGLRRIEGGPELGGGADLAATWVDHIDPITTIPHLPTCPPGCHTQLAEWIRHRVESRRPQRGGWDFTVDPGKVNTRWLRGRPVGGPTFSLPRPGPWT